jgi:HEAT repeat protein
MDSAADFNGRLNAVIERIEPGYRDSVRQDLQHLLDAGVQCDEDLFAIVEDTDSDPENRERAFWLLSRLGTPGTAPALFRALKDPNASLRAAAARLIGESGIKESVDRLVALLQSDPEPKVRKDAAYALGLLDDVTAVGAVVAALKDKSPMVRGMAAESLAYLRDPSAVGSLLETLQDPSAEVRYWGAFAIGEIGGEDAIPALRHLSDSDSEIAPGYGSVREEAEEAIRQIQARKNQDSQNAP